MENPVVCGQIIHSMLAKINLCLPGQRTMFAFSRVRPLSIFILRRGPTRLTFRKFSRAEQSLYGRKIIWRHFYREVCRSVVLAALLCRVNGSRSSRDHPETLLFNYDVSRDSHSSEMNSIIGRGAQTSDTSTSRLICTVNKIHTTPRFSRKIFDQ